MVFVILHGDEMKQVIVMRKDLNMRKGKMVAQGAHASMAAMLTKSHNTNIYRIPGSPVDLNARVILLDDAMDEWLNGPFTKICVGVDSEEELIEIFEKAVAAGIINCSLINDRGLTEFNGVPTKTCAAIGPADPELIDTITGHLKLL